MTKIKPSIVVSLILLLCAVGLITYLLIRINQLKHDNSPENIAEQEIKKQINENPNLGRILLVTPIPSPCKDPTPYTNITLANESPNGPEDVCMLDLTSKKLKLLPPEIKNFKNLSVIGLRDNELSSFPAELITLSHLTRIGLKENTIASIPPGISALKNLQVLNLSDNKLSTLPDSFGELKKLEHLILDNNSFRNLPKSVYMLKNLKTLSLIGNPLASSEKNKIKKFFSKTKVIFEQ